MADELRIKNPDKARREGNIMTLDDWAKIVEKTVENRPPRRPSVNMKPSLAALIERLAREPDLARLRD